MDVVAPSNKWQQTGNGKGVKSEGHPQQPGFPQQPTQQTQFTFVGEVVPCCYNKLIFLDDQFYVCNISDETLKKYSIINLLKSSV